MITLVPFYKDIQNDSAQIAEMKKVFDYKNAIERLHTTFMKYNPTHYFTLATDRHTQIKNNQIKLHRTSLDNMNIMESLTVSNTDYVTTNTGRMVLCGVDHLICADISNFFWGSEFDIGLYVRWDQINNTVVLVNKTKNNEKFINNFFMRRLEHFYDLDNDTKTWFGDQKSYSNLLQEENLIQRHLKENKSNFNAFNLRIKLMTYGMGVRPIKTGGTIKENPKNILIDFKGPKRKEHFENAFETIMSKQ